MRTKPQRSNSLPTRVRRSVLSVERLRLAPLCPTHPLRRTHTRVSPRAVDFRTYRLLKTGTGRFGPREAEHLWDHRKKRRWRRDFPEVHGQRIHTIQILTFLTVFNAACDDCGVAEETALRILNHSLVKPVQDEFISMMANLHGRKRDIEVIVTYPDAVYWLLETYATENVLA